MYQTCCRWLVGTLGCNSIGIRPRNLHNCVHTMKGSRYTRLHPRILCRLLAHFWIRRYTRNGTIQRCSHSERCMSKSVTSVRGCIFVKSRLLLLFHNVFHQFQHFEEKWDILLGIYCTMVSNYILLYFTTWNSSCCLRSNIVYHMWH